MTPAHDRGCVDALDLESVITVEGTATVHQLAIGRAPMAMSAF